VIKQIISCCSLFCETICVCEYTVCDRHNVMSCVFVVVKDKITLSTKWKMITVSLCNKVVTNNKSFVLEVVFSFNM